MNVAHASFCLLQAKTTIGSSDGAILMMTTAPGGGEVTMWMTAGVGRALVETTTMIDMAPRGVTTTMAGEGGSHMGMTTGEAVAEGMEDMRRRATTMAAEEGTIAGGRRAGGTLGRGSQARR